MGINKKMMVLNKKHLVGADLCVCPVLGNHGGLPLRFYRENTRVLPYNFKTINSIGQATFEFAMTIIFFGFILTGVIYFYNVFSEVAHQNIATNYYASTFFVESYAGNKPLLYVTAKGKEQPMVFSPTTAAQFKQELITGETLFVSIKQEVALVLKYPKLEEAGSFSSHEPDWYTNNIKQILTEEQQRQYGYYASRSNSDIKFVSDELKVKYKNQEFFP